MANESCLIKTFYIHMHGLTAADIAPLCIIFMNTYSFFTFSLPIKNLNTPHHFKEKIRGVQKWRVYLLTLCTDYALALAFRTTFSTESALVTAAPEFCASCTDSASFLEFVITNGVASG